MTSPPPAPSAPLPLSPVDTEESLSWFNDTMLAPLSLISLVLAAGMCMYELFLLVFILSVARDDKPIRQTGVGFLVYLLLGAICGQGMLLAHSIQLYRIGINPPEMEDRTLITTWTQCHVQPLLLLLHLELHAAPLGAKLWRIWFKIRKGETKRLQLWDRTAQRITAAQLLVVGVLMIVHIEMASKDADDSQRPGCIEDDSDYHNVEIQSRERYFFLAEGALIACSILPAWPLIAWVFGSSYAGSA